ncbi:MAG: hypothetical protein ACXVCS_22135, partial [Bdellovibrionota bacterium]
LIHRTHRRQAEAYQDVMLDFHNNGMVAFPRLTNIEAKGTSVSASVGLRVVRLGWEHSTYPSGGYVGRSFDQISTSPKGELNLNRDDEGKIFSKMSQAVNSAMDLAKLVHLDVRPGTAWTVAPLLVVPDDMLFVANYNDEGEMIDGPKRTVRCQFYLGQRLELGQGNQYRRATMHLSHLDIITIGELQPILRDYALEGKNSERKRLIPLT